MDQSDLIMIHNQLLNDRNIFLKENQIEGIINLRGPY